MKLPIFFQNTTFFIVLEKNKTVIFPKINIFCIFGKKPIIIALLFVTESVN